jgi:hypothetical protein
MESTVRIVEVSVLKALSISSEVNHFHWHSVCRCTEHRRLVHIVPNRVQVARSFESFIFKLLAPVILRILIKEINIGRITWPTVPIEYTIFWGSNENV